MSGSFLGPHRPAWVDQLLSPDSLRATGYFDAAAVARQRAWQVHMPRITPARGVFDVALDVRGLDPALAPHLLRRRPLRPSYLAALTSPPRHAAPQFDRGMTHWLASVEIVADAGSPRGVVVAIQASHRSIAGSSLSN